MQAQEHSPLVISRLTESIQLDGPSNEPGWAAVAPLPLTVYQPVFMAEPTERTEIRVAYDDDYFYLAARLYDSRPDLIQDRSLYRDEYGGDDGVALVLDTFNDNENALWFIVTAAGVRLDWAVSNDGQSSNSSQNGSGGRGAINRDWNTFWDVATEITDEGWFAEARIPFSSLGFQDVNGRVEMGLIAYRLIARSNERHIFPAISPEYDRGFSRPSLAQDVTLEGVYSRKPLYVSPYVLGGLGMAEELNSTETDFSRSTDQTNELGLDVKYSVTSNLTLDVTLNTDFAQVEADDQQINLTRLSLFFPEKRQFFQERASIFDFSTGSVDRLFYSRRIGLNEGEPVRILGGARMIGRVSDWDLGLINMQTARRGALPSENFGVVRLRRQIFNPYSSAGGLVTSRIGEDGTYNVAYGLDGTFRPFGDEYVTVRWAQTFDSELIDADAFEPLRASLFRVNWERRRTQGFAYLGTVKWYGEDFLPGMGFVTRENIVALRADASYGWFASQSSPLRTIVPGLSANAILRNADGSVQSAAVRQVWDLDSKRGARISGTTRLSYEDLEEALELPEDTEIPVGSYTFLETAWNYMAPRSKQIRTNGSLEGGMFYDGWRLSFGVEPTWATSRYLQLSTEYELNLVRFPDRDQAFDAHVARIRIQGALNRQVSANAFVQYNSAGDLMAANIRFRYNFREGNDLWIVYNEGLNTDRYAYSPIRPRVDNRIAMVKYTHTFRM